MSNIENTEVIVVLISHSFGKESPIFRMEGKDTHKDVLEAMLENSFDYKFHLCGIDEQEFNFNVVEKMYFEKGYRAYIRPFDTPKERCLALAVLQYVLDGCECEIFVQITFLYKLEEWNDVYKTFYYRMP
jgi:hypothetical protein